MLCSLLYETNLAEFLMWNSDDRVFKVMVTQNNFSLYFNTHLLASRMRLTSDLQGEHESWWSSCQ